MDSPMQNKGTDEDPGLQTDVDMLILDRLLYSAITNVLECHQSQLRGTLSDAETTKNAELAINSVDSFLEIFKSKYSLEDVSRIVQFRLDLLRFSIMFCHRLIPTSTTPSLDNIRQLRSMYRMRAQGWQKLRAQKQPDTNGISYGIQLPFTQSQVQYFRAQVLEHLTKDSASEEFYGSATCLSLMDLLPSFMYLSAARAQLNADFGITQHWMNLAGEFMLLSVLENYMCFRASDPELVNEAFAWGFLPGSDRHQSEHLGGKLDEPMEIDCEVEGDRRWDGEAVVNQMFAADLADEDVVDFGQDPPTTTAETEIEDWEEIRNQYMSRLRHGPHVSTADHFTRVAADFSMVTFEERIASYLAALSQSIEPPVLVQLERGQLAGLSVEETQDFKRRVGLEA